MTTLANLYHQTRMNPIPDKSSAFQNDGSYRIFHVSSRAKDESDDEVEKFAEKNLQVSGKDEGKRRRFSKKSFRLSHRGGFNSWKRKSNRNKGPAPSHLSPTDRSINSNDRGSSSLPSNNNNSKEKRATSDDDEGTHLTDADLLIGAIDQSLAHDDATLHNLLARADQLESNFKKQEFNKVPPTVVRPSPTQKGKRTLICAVTLTIVLLLLVLVVLIGIFLLLRRQKRISPI